MEKKRSLNFSKLETSLLIQLVERKKYILECSKLDAISVDKRNSAWREITGNFNKHPLARTYRDEKMLKKKYSNIKCHTKNWTIDNFELIANFPTELEMSKRDDEIDVPTVEAIKVEKDITENYNGTIRPDCVEYNNDEFLPLHTDYKESATFSNILDEYPTTNADFSRKDFLNQNNHYYENEENADIAWNALTDIKAKWCQEKAKLEIEILEIEHRERMKIMQMKHSLEMEKLELEKEKHRLEIELLGMEVAFKRRKLFNGVRS